MTYFKCIVTFANGRHKIIRMLREEIAHIVYKFRQMRKSLWRDEEVEVEVGGVKLCLNECLKMKFFNEYTGEEFLTLA